MLLAKLKRLFDTLSFSVHRFYVLFKDGTKLPIHSLELELKFLQKNPELVLAWEFNKGKFSTVGLHLAIPFLFRLYIGIGTPYWRKLTAHVKNKNSAAYGFIGDLDLASLMWGHGFDGGKIFKFSIYQFLFGGTTIIKKEQDGSVLRERLVFAPGNKTSYLRVDVERFCEIKTVKRLLTRKSKRYHYEVSVEYLRGDHLPIPKELMERNFLFEQGNKYECVIEQTLNDINLYLYK